MLSALFVCFNTSYVSVQVCTFVNKNHIKNSFNTSYVSVQVKDVVDTLEEIKRFQYILCVSVQDTGSYCTFNTGSFQYILCVGSRLVQEDSFGGGCLGFNTSYVSVQDNPTPLLKNIAWFQYILCVGSSFLLYQHVHLL